jgi:hypothetical protein
LRLSTHPKVFVEPAPVQASLRFLHALLDHGGTIPPIGDEWPAIERLCRDLTLAGNQIPSAWISAAVTVNGYHLITFDRDFRKLLRPSEYTLLTPRKTDPKH